MTDLETRFNALVTTYSERLYWHVRGIVGAHADTDDVLQDVFLKVWKALPEFRGESSEFTWLWRIATNEAVNFVKRDKFRRFVTLDFSSAPDLTATLDFNGDAVQAKLQSAIADLPPKQRSVFMMRYYEDLPYEEISSITGTSVGALKATYHFAKEKIEKSVGGI